MKKLIVAAATIASSTVLAVTVSGISSGGYFAHQFHVAHSSWVTGSGIVAGGPYNCSGAQLIRATNRCMNVFMGLPLAEDSVDYARAQANAQKIDAIENLRSGRAVVVHGTLDKTVDPKVGAVLVESYRRFGIDGDALKVEDQMAVGHAWPTVNFGNACREASKSPYISKCNRDISGDILRHLVGELPPRRKAKNDRLFKFSQGKAAELDKISLASEGFAYVPSACNDARSGCPVHVAFHGCKQTTNDIGQTFVTKTGLNDHAEAAGIIVIYPQAKANGRVGNPNGCWDWWGYAGGDYATKEGAQIKTVAGLIRAFQKGELKLTPVR